MATLVKISKIERQAEQVAARAEYIQQAVVSLHGDYAEVKSQFDAEETYRVQIENGVPVSCPCKDFYWRSKRDPSHFCKHCEATELCLAATLPMMGTPEMARLIKSTEKLFKVRRSAANLQLIAALQIATGARVRMNGGRLVVKYPKVVVAQVVALSPVCLPVAA